ncbi:hypothetical protein ACLK19_04000 [Escherichia coli]
MVVGLAQADTLRMRFTEDNGEVCSGSMTVLIFELPEIIDLRTNIDPHGTAQVLMLADLHKICASIAVNHGLSSADTCRG